MAGKLATNDARTELISLVKELALQFGDFTLASGKKASFYLDCRKVSLHGRGARLIGELMLDELEGDLPDAVGGMAIGADPITAALITVADYRDTPLRGFIVRKEAKAHGTGKDVEGPVSAGDRVVIVEGYMDAVVTHQYGTRNVVACIGSAITEKHIRQIKKLTRRVTLALDPDAAGESATLRGITVAQQAFDRMVVPVPGPAPDNMRSQQNGWATRGKRGAPRGIVRFEEQVDAAVAATVQAGLPGA